MSKKTLKILLAIVAVVTTIAGIIYFINNRKSKAVIDTEEEFEPEEEHLDAADALDLSSLKFSRHYVDLR